MGVIDPQAAATTQARQRYIDPADVVDDPGLSFQQKLAVLDHWQNEMLALPEFDAESLLGGARSRLKEVLRAKQALLGSAQHSRPA